MEKKKLCSNCIVKTTAPQKVEVGVFLKNDKGQQEVSLESDSPFSFYLLIVGSAFLVVRAILFRKKEVWQRGRKITDIHYVNEGLVKRITDKPVPSQRLCSPMSVE